MAPVRRPIIDERRTCQAGPMVFGLFRGRLIRIENLLHCNAIQRSPPSLEYRRLNLLRRTTASVAGALTDQSKRSPKRRIGISRRRRVAEISEHRLTQRLGPARPGIGLQTLEG